MNAQQIADWKCNVQRFVQRCICCVLRRACNAQRNTTPSRGGVAVAWGSAVFMCPICIKKRIQPWSKRSAQIMQKLVALNENGRRIGQSHPRAKLLDHEVDQVLALLESGLSYAEVAGKFDVSKSCVAHIATGRRRAQAVDRTVRVSVNR